MIISPTAQIANYNLEIPKDKQKIKENFKIWDIERALV